MIKSKKADAYLQSKRLFPSAHVPYERAIEAVELAESELYTKEQCIEAFKLSCYDHKYGDLILCKCDASEGNNCERRNCFITALKALKQ